MKPLYRGLVFGALLVASAPGWAQAPAPAPVPENRPLDVVTYIEVAPSAKTETVALLKNLATTSRKDAGNRRFDILQRIDRDTQFAILEGWSDAKAAQAHDAGAAMTQFRDKLAPLRTGHYDERPGIRVAGMPAAGPIASGSVYALTHVDVAPRFTEQTIGMMRKLADESRQEPGSEEFEAWQQTDHPNHFTLVAVWKDRPEVESHILSAHTKAFREEVGPALGALYDERYYAAIQ